MKRRTFLKNSAILGGSAVVSACLGATPKAMPMPPPPVPPVPSSPVAFVKTIERVSGVKQALALLDLPLFKGKNLFLKPNFNSADVPPGSTHNDVLSTLVGELFNHGADRISVGDRSGMGNTRGVMDEKGIFRMAEELAFDALVFDELDDDDWELQQVPDGHWQRGFAVPRYPLHFGCGAIDRNACRLYRQDLDLWTERHQSFGSELAVC